MIHLIDQTVVATHSRLKKLKLKDLQDVSVKDLFKISDDLDSIIGRLDKILPRED
jgi:hypothetical protein